MSRAEETDEDPLEEVLERFLEERPSSLEGFIRRHPEHAQALRELLPALEVLGGRRQALLDGSPQGGRTLLERWRKAREEIAAGGSLTMAPTGAAARGAPEDFVPSLLARVRSHGYPVGRFEARGELARGGQGVVLAVWDETLRRPLAMKVALAAAEGDATSQPLETRRLSRFLEEAQVTARLDHPGIVPVHDLGLDPESRVYFTMKLVKGRDLQEIFELVRAGEEGWNETRALNILLKVCEAMAYAHSKGVIHRDLKPSNVMVGKFGEVYVMDWGLARDLGSEDRKDIRIRSEPASELSSSRHEPGEVHSPLVTMDGDVVGTPAYMPPEQARGELEAIGAHSDVYAVGAMLYQLLTAHVPYDAGAASLGHRAILARVQQGPPERVHALARDVPAELEAICEKAMARDPRERYPDMSRLSEDLRAYLEHRVVGAYETGALAELRKWIARNRGLAAASAAGIVLALGGLAGVGYVQAEGKRVADAERTNVLRLSAFQELEDLQRKADELWPPEPGLLREYDDWLRRAQGLVAGLNTNPDGTQGGYRGQLAALEARALPYTDAEREADRESHPRLAELGRLEKKLDALRKVQAVREGRARVEEVLLGGEMLGLDPWTLNELAVPLILPTRIVFGEEARGLALARRATSMENPNAYQRANNLDTLAWALFANGLDEEALAASERSIDEAPPADKETFRSSREGLRTTIEAARMHLAIPRLEEELHQLEAALARRVSWRFDGREDLWWHAQLQRLIAAIEAFADPETGLIGGVSREHGWGVERRKARAETLEKETLSGADAARRWAEAADSIGDPARCPPYDGLVIEPQLGLVPIGRDPDSGLWEFAHALTGTLPERDASGRLVLTEESGLVFVLLPGGSFAMGAQSTDPAGRNYDKSASLLEFPVHTVKLAPFFLSKYEVTQAQWQRFTGHNPSSEQLSDMQSPLPLHPVEQVSWNDCHQFCARLGLALPSEAQWEYAARGGTTSAWWTGDERDSLLGAVNLAGGESTRAKQIWPGTPDWPELDDGYVHHAPVDKLLANPFGLHHMIGNLWEWCLDYWDSGFYSHSPEADPVAPRISGNNRVFRGSSYRNTAWLGRSAYRAGGASPDTASLDAGLRPARAIVGKVHQVTETRSRK